MAETESNALVTLASRPDDGCLARRASDTYFPRHLGSARLVVGLSIAEVIMRIGCD